MIVGECVVQLATFIVIAALDGGKYWCCREYCGCRKSLTSKEGTKYWEWVHDCQEFLQPFIHMSSYCHIWVCAALFVTMLSNAAFLTSGDLYNPASVVLTAAVALRLLKRTVQLYGNEVQGRRISEIIMIVCKAVGRWAKR